jgi:diguanylate cyclase (GGDEF)-like protein
MPEPGARAVRPSRWLAAGLLLAALLLGAPLAAAPAAPAAAAAPPRDAGLAVLVTPDTITVDQARAGRAGPFTPLDGDALALRPREGQRVWLRVPVPPAGPGDGDRLLVFDRVAIDRVALHAPDGQVQVRGFYAPPAEEPLFPGLFAFPLAPGEAGPLLLEVEGRVYSTLRPRVVPAAAYAASDRAYALLFAAVYTVLAVVAMSALSLYLALRDRLQLVFVGFALAALALLLANNGHLVALPGFAWLGAAGPRAVLLASSLFGLAALLLAREFAGIARATPRLDVLQRLLGLALVALALAAAFVPAGALRAVHLASGLAWGLAMACTLASAWLAWRGGGGGTARAVLLVWAVMWLAVALRVLASVGLAPAVPATMLAFQPVLACGAFLLSLAMAGRVMEFRQQRDRSRLAKEQSDASLLVEQGRRRFVEGIHSGLRGAPSGDLEWMAYRRLLEGLKPLIPQRGAAVIAFGYHGLDLLITEPLTAKDRFSRLLGLRGGTLKGICRSRSNVQLRIDLPADAGTRGGLFAVIPLPIARPGWGALLIERALWEGFDPEELQLAAEFAGMATAACDENAQALDLKRKAELDALTGALNRRAIDAATQEQFRRCRDGRMPMSVLFVDLDHFKRVNDTRGHAVGDQCLRELSEAIRHHLGPEDLFGRYGGEEFIVLLPNRTGEQARVVGERLRVAVEALEIETDGPVLKVTASIGVGSRLADEVSPQAMVERADKALYAAKRAGRNQVQVATHHGAGREHLGSLPF